MLPSIVIALSLATDASPVPAEAASVPADSVAAVAPAAGADSSASFASSRDLTASDRDAPRGVDYLWVLRTALLDRASIDSVVARAVALGARGLLVQVVGRGDAFHDSDLLPRAEALVTADRSLRPGQPPFDPLGELIAGARAQDLEVHAWVNAMLVWSAPQPPSDPRHVVHMHPEWIACTRDGRRMSRIGALERKRMGVEGVFLAPAHPGTRTWVARVAREIALRYRVDGIHLDYIRMPDAAVGYDPTTRARFALEAGVDPARLDLVPFGERARVDSAWSAFRREAITAVVREVRDSLNAVRPGLALTAAVIADTAKAERVNAQSWRSWLRAGLVDRVFLMCYAPDVQTVMNQLLSVSDEFATTGRVVPGVAVYNTTMSTVAVKIRGAHALGYPVLALYSYDSLYARRDRWTALRDRLHAAPDDLNP